MSLIRIRLLRMSSVCIFVAATGLLLQAFFPIRHAHLAALLATEESTEETGADPQGKPPSPPRPDGLRNGLGDLLTSLPPWQRWPDDEAKPRVSSPSGKKRPGELDEALELWRPFAELDH